MTRELQTGLERLRTLTTSISDLKDISELSNGNVRYHVEKGDCGGEGLLKTDIVAVQDAYLVPDTILTNHQHPETEYLIVYEGDITFHTPDGKIELKKGDFTVFEPNTPHLASSINGCKLIAVTIPASEGYPKSKTTQT